MPAIGTNNNYRAVLPAPPKPSRPAPAAPRQAGHMVGMPAVTHVNAPAARPGYVSATGGSDAATSGPGYGSAQANHFKTTPQYRSAVVGVFHSLPQPQKDAVLRGLMTHGMAGSAEAQAIFSATGEKGVGSTVNTGLTIPGLSSHMAGDLATENARYRASGILPVASATLPNLGAGAGHLLANTVSDLYHLPGLTVTGMYDVGNELVHAHFGNAFNMLTDPYVRFFKDPAGTFFHHPVDTVLMWRPGIIGRSAGAVARSRVFGQGAADFASTAREPLRLPDVAGHKGAPIEARSYSRNLITNRAQKAVAKARGENANIAGTGPVARLMHTSAGAKIRRVADEMTAVRQMVGRTERGLQLKTMAKEAPPKEVRNVVSHILQGVVRTPSTAVKDIQAEIDRLRPFAAQTVRKPSVAWARAQIKDLQLALEHKDQLPAAFKTAGALRTEFNAIDAYLVRNGLLDHEQAQRRNVTPYALVHMADQGVTFHPVHGLVDKHGDSLPTEDAYQHLRDNGVPDPAYVGHFPGKVAPWRFYSSYRMARGTLGSKRTTMQAFHVGGYDHSYAGLAGQAAHRAEILTRAGLHDRIVSRFGVERPESMMTPRELKQVAGIKGMLASKGLSDARRVSLRARLEELHSFTAREAQAFTHAASHDANGEPVPGAIPYAAVSRAPHSALDTVPDLQHPHTLIDDVNHHEIAAVTRAMNDVQRRARQGDRTRNVVLVPKDAVDRFTDQFARQGKMAKEVGRFTQQFRRTVLPYSTHWMMQIGSEAAIRGLVRGVMDPRNALAGRQLVRHLEGASDGRAALAEMTGATFGGMDRTFGIHHDANPVLAAAKAAPVARQVIAAHNHYADFVGSSMNKFEHAFRVMGLGKLARGEIQEFTGAYQAALRVQGHTMASLAERLKADPNLVAKFGREIDNTFGKYNKLGPTTRAAVQTWMPFLPWYMNAARFVFWHLPAKSPLASSLLAALRMTVRQDIQNGKEKPLDPFALDQLARITPFGIIEYPSKTGESPVGTMATQAAGIFNPMFQGSIYNLQGLNSFGDAPLSGPGGDAKAKSGAAVFSAIESALEGVAPGARQLRLGLEHSRSSYGTSTIWKPQGKGGHVSAGTVLSHIFNPTFGISKALSGGSSSSGGGTGSPSFGSPSFGSGGSFGSPSFG